MGLVPHYNPSAQFDERLLPAAEYIKENPNLRPHIWAYGTWGIQTDGFDFMKARGGIVVYRDDETKTDFRIVPRALRLEHMPGFYAPFESYVDPSNGKLYRVVDWVRVDPSLHTDIDIAIRRTIRKAFCYRYKGNPHLFDVFWTESLWQPEPQDRPPRALQELCWRPDAGGDTAP